jgi:hypothetical protein
LEGEVICAIAGRLSSAIPSAMTIMAMRLREIAHVWAAQLPGLRQLR